MGLVSNLKKASHTSSDKWNGPRGNVKASTANREEGQGFRWQLNQRLNTTRYEGRAYNITCKWEPFKKQILEQWKRLTSREVNQIGPNRSRLAMLIENKYGIAAHIVENYLRNFERTLPLI